MATFEQYNLWQTTGLNDLTSPLALAYSLQGKRNHGYLWVKLAARSREDHDTHDTTVIQTIDIRAAKAGMIETVVSVVS